MLYIMQSEMMLLLSQSLLAARCSLAAYMNNLQLPLPLSPSPSPFPPLSLSLSLTRSVPAPYSWCPQVAQAIFAASFHTHTQFKGHSRTNTSYLATIDSFTCMCVNVSCVYMCVLVVRVCSLLRFGIRNNPETCRIMRARIGIQRPASSLCQLVSRGFSSLFCTCKIPACPWAAQQKYQQNKILTN